MDWRPKGMVIHNTGGSDHAGLDAASVRQTLKARGLLGYHWLHELADYGYWTLMLADPSKPAAHVAHHNSEYVGYAMVGNFNAYAPDPARLLAAACDVAALLHLYGLTPDTLIAHRDVPDNNTDCPGKLFTPKLFEQFRTIVAELFKASA
jgi:hypothetical protein